MVDIICLAKDLNICGCEKNKEVSFFLKAQTKKKFA